MRSLTKLFSHRGLSLAALLVALAAAAPGRLRAADPADDPEYKRVNLQLRYWYTYQYPDILGDATAGVDGYNFRTGTQIGKSKHTPDIQLTFPAGNGNRLAIEVFRVQYKNSTTLPNDTAIFSQAFTAGQAVDAKNTLTNFKISWDYLNYPAPAAKGDWWQFRTLWEVQGFVSNTGVIATDGSVVATHSRTFVRPTFGAELYARPGKAVSFRAYLSGFGMSGHGGIGDGEVSANIHSKFVTAVIGVKGFYGVTSPKDSITTRVIAYGPFVALEHHF